jgi:hypothetical protein
MRACAGSISASRSSVPLMAIQSAVLGCAAFVGLAISLTYASWCARHEGEGSVFAVLKARGWAVELSAGESGMSFSAASLFSVNIVLTDEGASTCRHAMNGGTRSTRSTQSLCWGPSASRSLLRCLCESLARSASLTARSCTQREDPGTADPKP